MAESDYKQLSSEDIAGGIKLSDISEMGALVPAGRYKVRLSRVEAKDSKSAIPMVLAGFDVHDGIVAPPKDGSQPVSIESLKGVESTVFYSMYVGKSEKSGRTIAPGIMEFKAAAAAVGKPLPDDFIIPGNPKEFARLVHDTLHPRSVGDLEAVVLDEPDRNDKTKTRTRTRIVGRWGGSGAPEIPIAAGSSGTVANIV
jgi:hypothetical protein